MVLLPESQLNAPPLDEPMVADGSERIEKRGRPAKDSETAILSKLWKAINIVLKLHTSSMVDTSGQLLDAFGKPVANANLVNLIHYSLSKGRARVGETEYIRALHKARVPIEWLVNQDIISKYQRLGQLQPVSGDLLPEQQIVDSLPPPLTYYGPTSVNAEPEIVDETNGVGPLRTEARTRPSPYSKTTWQKKHDRSNSEKALL